MGLTRRGAWGTRRFADLRANARCEHPVTKCHNVDRPLEPKQRFASPEAGFSDLGPNAGRESVVAQ